MVVLHPLLFDIKYLIKFYFNTFKSDYAKITDFLQLSSTANGLELNTLKQSDIFFCPFDKRNDFTFLKVYDF